MWISGCTRDLTTEPHGPSAPSGPSYEVSDAAHNGGLRHFYFLPQEENYAVNWQTGMFNLDLSKTYRVIAKVSGTELGHVDVLLRRHRFPC